MDLGSELRAARETRGISLSEAEAATRIKERYLKALEANDWAALPTRVQARGFLRNYAVYLGMDEDQVVSRFSQVSRSVTVSLPSPAAADSQVRTTGEDGAVFDPRDIAIDRMAGLPAWVSSDIFIGVALALVVAIVGFLLVNLAVGGSGETATKTPGLAPGMTTVVPQSATLPGTSVGGGVLATITPTFDVSTEGIQLSLEATEHVWARVTVDGVQLLEGILAPGASQTWQGTQQIMLETANGAGLKAVVNGQPQEPLGERGQALVLVWGPNGLVNLTPTAAP